MNEQRYNKISQFFTRHSVLLFLLKFIYTFLPFAVFLAYPALIIVLFIMTLNGEADRATLIKCVTVPAVTFLALTVLRRFINRPRPYETYNIKPLIPRDKKGESFPSRHTASVFIIAMVYLYLNTAVGIAALIIGIMIAASRVLAGVHFIKDVVVGALFSVILGVFGLFII